MKILKFQATWCKPCSTLSQLINTIKDSVSVIDIEEVDIDQNTDLALKYEIRGIPVMLKFDDHGNMIDKIKGIPSRDDLISFIKKEDSQ